MKNFGVSTPVAGAGVALALGLLLGTAMRPQLAIGELSPQPLDAWPRELSPTDGGSPDALAFAQYGGKLPDYVLGVDWLAATTPPAEARASEPAEPEPDVGDADQPAAAADEAASAATDYGRPVAAQAKTPAARPAAARPDGAPSGDTATPPAIPALPIDETAPPSEATGDTSRPEP